MAVIDSGNAIADQIERWFEEGRAAATRHYDEHSVALDPGCPYENGTLAAHWWARGYVYDSRLHRALRAEGASIAMERTIRRETN